MSAQTPEDHLVIVAPAAPGGGWDQTAREMQRELERHGLARVVQVQNVPGAAGTIGLAQFIDAGAATARRCSSTAWSCSARSSGTSRRSRSRRPRRSRGSPASTKSSRCRRRRRTTTCRPGRGAPPAARGVRVGRRLRGRHRPHPGRADRRGGRRRSAADELHRVLRRRRSGDGAARRTGDGRHQRLQRVRPAHRVGPPAAPSGFRRPRESPASTRRRSARAGSTSSWRTGAAFSPPPGIADADRVAAHRAREPSAHSDAWRRPDERGWTDLYLAGAAFDEFSTPSAPGWRASSPGCAARRHGAPSRSAVVVPFSVLGGGVLLAGLMIAARLRGGRATGGARAGSREPRRGRSVDRLRPGGVPDPAPAARVRRGGHRALRAVGTRVRAAAIGRSRCLGHADAQSCRCSAAPCSSSWSTSRSRAGWICRCRRAPSRHGCADRARRRLRAWR